MSIKSTLPALYVRRRIDIFCAVIDNLGDMGVCWRLARQLVHEHGHAVRLWIDQPSSFPKICPDYQLDQVQQCLAGVEICHWRSPFQWPAANTHALADTTVAETTAHHAAEVVIEAFACTLPATYLDAMRQRRAQSLPCLWINLEYLSAETWVRDAHGLPSPVGHGLPHKIFFFPGFEAETGGLLREATLLTQRDQFAHNLDAQLNFYQQLGIHPPTQLAHTHPQTRPLVVSLFSYTNPQLPSLLEAWIHSPRPVYCLVPEGAVLDQVRSYFHSAPRTRAFAQGQLTLVRIPFVPQTAFDQLLWLCDLNLIRGEDSFVRAQWAAKPLIWHIYPQDDDIHLDKLQAWLARYNTQLPPHAQAALQQFHQFWNHNGKAHHAFTNPALMASPCWQNLLDALPVLTQHAQQWAHQLTHSGDLTSNLSELIANQLK